MTIDGAMLLRSRAFWAVHAAFVAANLVTMWRLYRVGGDYVEYHAAGFPFPVYGVGPGMPGEVYVYGILLDLAVAVTAALIVVWIVQALRGPR